jgi:hypothetical protein
MSRKCQREKIRMGGEELLEGTLICGSVNETTQLLDEANVSRLIPIDAFVWPQVFG